jgi:hypothetical protein
LQLHDTSCRMLGDTALYGVRDDSPRAHPLTAGQPAPALHPGERLYYCRSSLCSTQEAGTTCESLEARYALEEIENKSLPARR